MAAKNNETQTAIWKAISRRRTSTAVLTAVLLGGWLVSNHVGFAQQVDIQIGDTVTVVTGGSALNLRAEPGLEGEVMAKLAVDTAVKVVGGPRVVDGQQWWQVESESGIGWSAAQYLRVKASPSAVQAMQPATQGPLSSAPSSYFVPGGGDHIADTYGFSSLCSDWYRTSHVTQTIEAADHVASVLSDIGYSSTAHRNASPSQAAERLLHDEVFFFFGHGGNNYIQFLDDECSASNWESNADSTTEAPHLRFALLLGCETGRDTDAPDNIMRQFAHAGADRVIGFPRTVPVDVADYWNSHFWQYAAVDGMEVYQAARKAAADSIPYAVWNARFGLPVAVVGTTQVYLVSQPAQEKEPPLGRPSVPSVQPDNVLERWGAAIQAWFDQLLQSLQERLNEWLDRQMDNLLTKLVEFTMSLMQQCCAAPLGVPLAAAGIHIWRHRQAGRRR
jgi:hypothetical protein